MTDRDHASHAGRGLLSIAGAKIFFVVAGFAVQFLLPRFLGSAERYGLLMAAMSGVSILNNVMVTGTVQTVSKFVSEAEDRSAATIRRALGLQVGLGLALGGGLALSAGSLASAMRDPELAGLLRISSLVVVAYSLYATLIGALNGLHRFQQQARFDVSFTAMRTLGLLVGPALGLGVASAMAGFATAAWAITFAAFVAVGAGASGETVSLRRWLAFMAPIWIYQTFLNGILQLDVWILKGTVAGLEVAAGATREAAAALSNQYVGYYRAAQTFAFVPYQLILSMTFIVFPMVSRATALGDDALAQATVRQAMRFSLLALLAFAAPMAGASDGVLRIAYAPDYLAGAGALQILVLGLVAFALFVIAATILGGAGQPTVAAVVAGIALVVVLGGNYGVLHAVGVGGRTLVGAASATSAGMAIALVLSGFALYRRFGTFLPAASVARGLVAGLVAAIVAHFVPHGSRLLALVALAAGFFAFLATLVITGEVEPEERAKLVRIVKRT
ncbi:MAG: polysaccharide biosynthesis C-terminal domain-containing protein [Polyangiales bacterium]